MAQTTAIDYETISDALEGEMGWDFTAKDCIRADYSGRGMFGEECFGVVLESDSQFSRFLLALGETEPDLARDLADRVRTDSMGMSGIWYFPGFTLENVPEEDDD
jgi:hypothetical protein